MARKRIATFPPVFFEYAAMAARGEHIQPVRMPDRRAADSTRHAWHRFRQFLVEQRHPHAEAALDLIARITNLAPIGKEGDYIIELVPRGLYNLAQELKGERPLIPLDKDNLPSFEPAPIPGHIDAEELVAKMMGSNLVRPDDCVHEPDSLGVRCLKCNKPLI